ncbi:MAG: nickel-dependent lactate racemase [Spirochaetes bacterium]|nr:nickel-dependent lactate racemase [Spirochaetota bacterium]
MIKNITMAYGKKTVAFEIPTENLIAAILPEKVSPIKDFFSAVEKSIQNPEGSPPLRELIDPAKKIVFIVDDNTRPTPTKNIIHPILLYLQKYGVPRYNISIIFALGAHRKMTRNEMASLVGEETIDSYAVSNHEAYDAKALLYLGTTRFGTPLYVNKTVVDADLRILIGMIKPHNQAGYTGGGKSILPGVCGIDTIVTNHSFNSTGHPMSRLGITRGNPIRDDIEDALTKIGPSFIVNLVMDHLGNIGGIFSGDYIHAHKEGIKYLDGLVKKEINEQADICICGTPSPIDINFYQMLNSLSAPYRVRNPILKDNGIIIVAGRADEGISSGNFYQSVSESESLSSLWEKIKTTGTISIIDRAALHIFLEGASKYDIVIVSEEKNRPLIENMNMKFFNTIDDALSHSFEMKGTRARVAALPYAPYTICNYHK